MGKPAAVGKDVSTCFHLAMATWTMGALCREKALSKLPNGSMVKNGSSRPGTQDDRLTNKWKPAPTFSIGGLEKVLDTTFEREEVKKPLRAAWRRLHNARARSKHYSFKDRSVSNHRLNLSLCNRKRRVVALVRNTQNLQEGLRLWQMRLHHSTGSQASNFLEPLLDHLQLCCRCNKVSKHRYSIPCLAH